MANLTELLVALNSKEGFVSTADLANELKSSQEGTLKQLGREKDKGHVDGTSKDGWQITDAGRVALEKGETSSTMIDEGVTPRQQFEAIGRLIGIKEDRITLATNMVWSGDYENIVWVWAALGREGADLADDLRRVWANQWRAKLHKSIPPELETELTGVSNVVAEAGGDAPRKSGGRDYIIVDDEPVRVGENLGDYGLQDAKDLLSIRAVRERFRVSGPVGGAPQMGAAERVSDVLTALEPYINNKGTDIAALKEVLADKLALQKQDILASIPPPGPHTQPKSFIEEITAFTAALGSLKEVGPMLRSVLGVPEPSGNPSSSLAGVPVSVTGPDGQPTIMDLGQVIEWKKFLGDEKRADERHNAVVGLAQTVRENIGDGISALKAAAEEAKGSSTNKSSESPPETPQVFKCGDCQTEFRAPAEWAGEPIICPKCDREYTKEELLA